MLLLPWIEWKRYCYFSRYLKENDVDFVLSFTNTTNLLAALWKSFHKVPIIFLSERSDPNARNFFLQRLILFLYQFANGIICQNEYSKKYFLKHHFRIPLPVLPNPLNFQDIPVARGLLKKREIVTVGRLSPQKNHILLIEAFKDIAQDYPQYVLKIYGVGPMEAVLKKRIALLGLTDRVFLMGAKKRVMFDVQKSDFFVLSSDFEGFPNVLIEAMASGLPVISSNFPTGIARQLIVPGENGFLFPVQDKQALVLALKDMLGCRKNWKKMGEKNTQIAQSYSVNKVSALWFSTIVRIIGEKDK